MSIRVTCGKCGSTLKVKEDQAGTKGKCPSCRGTLYVPTLDEAAAGKTSGAPPPLSATETSSEAGGETTALKVPTKTQAPPAAAESNGEGTPSRNGSAPPPPAAEAKPSEKKPVEKKATDENPTGEKSTEKEPAEKKKARLRMSDDDDAPPAAAESKEQSTLSRNDSDPPSPAAEAKPPEKKPAEKKKAKLRMSDDDDDPADPSPTDPVADDKPKAKSEDKPKSKPEAAPIAEAPEELAKPAKDSGKAKPAAAKAEAEDKPKAETKPAAKDGDFDLDSFLMEGPKPKALPPVSESEPAGKKGPPQRGVGGRKLSMSDDETNVSGPSETLPPPNRRGGAGESAIAALGGGGGTSTSARDLLARASQEGRARASSMPGEQPKERFDYAGAFKDIFKEYGYHIIGVVALCGVLYFGMNYMMSDAPDIPKLARVYGRVTYKKQPLANVEILFHPIGSKDAKGGNTQKTRKGKPPSSASAMTDSDGKYELHYMEGVRGAVVGQNRVELKPITYADFKRVPPTFLEKSGPVQEVKETGGEINFDIP